MPEDVNAGFGHEKNECAYQLLVRGLERFHRDVGNLDKVPERHGQTREIDRSIATCLFAVTVQDIVYGLSLSWRKAG